MILKHAIINALLTSLYIGLIASFLFYGPTFFDLAGKPDTVFAPIMMLMLFVFSAAITGALMLGRPMVWFLDGKRKEAIRLFFYTLVIFFIIMLVAFFVLTTTSSITQKASTNLPEGYSLDTYEVKETLNVSCTEDIDCKTPGEYLIQSNCPYTSLCLKNKCTVVCPGYTGKQR